MNSLVELLMVMFLLVNLFILDYLMKTLQFADTPSVFESGIIFSFFYISDL